MSEKEKIIRDKHIENPWPDQKYRIAPEDEIPILLNNKVAEETSEFLAVVDSPNSNLEKIALEAGDAIEAILARAKIEGISAETIEKIRRKTKKDRGGFEKGIVLIKED